MRRVLDLVVACCASCLLGGCAVPKAQDDSGRLASAMARQPVVLLGEIHDNAAQHAMRAQALAELLARGARPALLMEQFDRERQGALDAALARPGATADEVIAAGSPGDAAMQGWSWPLYRPYVALALQYRLPIVAANVSRDDTRLVLRSGLPALGFDAHVPADIEAAQAEAILEGHCGMIDATTAQRMVAAQVARDQFMARMIEANLGRGAVLLAGDGHVRRDLGVPRWLTPATRARSISIGLLERGEPGQAGQAGPARAAYDLAFYTPAQARPDPCDGMGVPAKKATPEVM